MKKLMAYILIALLSCMNSCYAFSELHYFKGIKTSAVEPVVYTNLMNHGFNVVKQNPFYAVSQDGDDYAVIILQQSGDNMFYYYQADKNSKVNKAVLREMKRQNIICEQSFNTGIISVYDNLAQELVANSGVQKKYTFEDEPVAVLQTQPQQNKQTRKQQTYSGYVAQIAAGTKFNVYLQNAINTASALKGDEVIAVVSDPYVYNGQVIIPQGSLVYGTLSKARNATYGSRNGRIVINFNKIVTPENQVYDISAEEIDFTVSNDGKIGTAAKNVVTHAAVGALVGMLFALLTDSSVGRGAAIGAGVGGGGSLVYSAAEKGVDAEIPSFTELEITLTKPFNVSITGVN